MWVVDRFEGDHAVLEREDGTTFHLSRSVLPPNTSEGDALRASKNPDADRATWRIEHGVSEVPRKPRPEIPPMPKALLDYCNAFATPSLRKMYRDEAYKRAHVQGQSWEIIMADVMGEDKDAIQSGG